MTRHPPVINPTLMVTYKEKTKMSDRIILPSVRLSFPSLFHKAEFQGTETKYEATFLIPKSNKKLIASINEKIADLLKANKSKMLAPDKLCLKDGDLSDYDGYSDHMSLKAANDKRPQVIDRRKNPVTEDDDLFYAGCYVTASCDLWFQNNAYGKRINANLYGVQFIADGEEFGRGASPDVSDDFDDLGDDEDDNDEL